MSRFLFYSPLVTNEVILLSPEESHHLLVELSLIHILTHFLNVGLVLLYSWYNVFHLSRYSPYVLAISLSNLLLYVYALYAGFHLFQNKKPMTSKESQVLSP